VFVPFTRPDGAVVVSVPQGWARSSDGPATVFTDKFNSVRVEDAPRPSAADVASSRGGRAAAAGVGPGLHSRGRAHGPAHRRCRGADHLRGRLRPERGHGEECARVGPAWARLRPPRPESPIPEPFHGKVRRRQVLGGLINEYEPAA
jgi:hypothetical protein